MSVRERLEDARLLWANGRKEGAFLMILVAADATAKKRYPSEREVGKRFKQYIRDEMATITGGPKYNVAFPFNGEDKVPLEEILYKHLRCELVHEASVPSTIVLIEPEMYQGELLNVMKLRAPLGFPVNWGWNCFKAVWDSPENDKECGR